MKQCPGFIMQRPHGAHRVSWLLTLCLLLLMLALPALSITLVSGGSTTYVIAKKTGCDTTESQAATDIQTYLNTISGVTIPIYSYADISTVPANAIVIGTLTTSPALTLEQVQMKVSSTRLVLRGGSSTAHRYAVFAFLEEYLGCRFYSPTVEYIPSMSTVTVDDDYDVTETPSFEYRYLYQQDVTTNATWCVKNRVNGQVTIDGTHNLYSIVPLATYWATHPEYYPMKNGVRVNTDGVFLCFTNNDLPQIIANYVNGRMAATNANTIINVGQGDGYGGCECPSCSQAFTEEGGALSGVMLRCLNATADIVAQSYPNRRMMTFAYMSTEKYPVTAPRSNLMIRLCHWRRCELHGLDECSTQDPFVENLVGWQNITTPEQLYIWEYGTSFKSPCAIWPNVYALIPNMQYYWDHDVRGMFYQGVYWGKGGDLSQLKMYLLAKVLWNKDVDATTVYNDFLNGYYGDAADEMADYIDLLEDRGRDETLNFHPNGITFTLDDIKAKLLPDSVFSQADNLYDAAEAAASAVSQTLYDRVHYDRASLSFMHIYNKLQLSRISSPADRLVKLGDNNYYNWKEAFFSVIGDRGCGDELRCAARSREEIKAQQGGDVLSIENDAVRLAVCPGASGAMIALTDKPTGRQILMPAILAMDTTNYPFNGYYSEAFYDPADKMLLRSAATSSSVVTDGDGTQHLTVVCETGVGSWTPITPTHRITREIILPPGNVASFTTSVKVKNLTTNTYNDWKLEGRLMLGGVLNFTTITATLPDDSTQQITSFPTSLNVKQLTFDNTKYGFRLSTAFSTQLPTTTANININSENTFNTVVLKYNSGTFSETASEEKEVLNATWTLSAITPTPTSAADVVFKDLYKTSDNYEFGSQLFKTSGIASNFDGDATSTKLMGGNCAIEWTFANQAQQNVFGLSEYNVNQSSASIKYSVKIFVPTTGTPYWSYQVMESNAYKGNKYAFTTSTDRFRIERVGNTVYYKCNGTTFYTSLVTSTAPLMVDAAMYAAGEKNGVFNCTMEAQSYIDAPTVSLTAPTAGTVYAPGSNIALTATAVPPADGSSITKVEFYRGGTTKLGEDTSSPYSYTWNNVSAGSYALTARAITSNVGNSTSAPVSIRVNTLPTTSITSPTTGTLFHTPATITIAANAADTDGTITLVEFYQGTTKLGEDATSPYSFDWSNVSSGSYALTTKAIDSDNGVKISSAVNVEMNASPTAGITAPSDDAVFTAPASFTITADASDTDGSVSTVEFYQGQTLLGDDSTSPYSYDWANVAAGSYTLTVKAIDNDNGITTSSAVDIVVNTLPTVTLTAPANNEHFLASSTIALTADASDSDGAITKVEFYNGTTKLGEDTSSPYSYDWTSVAADGYTLTAVATDNNSGVTTSSARSINVWASVEIATTTTGSTSYSSPTFTIAGSGGSQPSACRYIYRPISGNFTVTARVTTFAPASSNARAGVMIRSALTNTSMAASSLFRAASGYQVYFNRRLTVNGTIYNSNLSASAAPYWVRMVRSGTTFSAYKSSDGSSWTQVGPNETINMADAVYVGLSVNSGYSGSTVTATFDNVAITSP